MVNNMKRNKYIYYVKELNQEFDNETKAEDALEAYIKDYYLVGVLRAPEGNYYIGQPKVEQKAPYTCPGYTIEKRKIKEIK